MRDIKLHKALAFVAIISLSPIAAADAVTVGLGLFNGLSVEYHKALNKRFNARFALTTMSIGAEEEYDGIEYDIEYKKNNIGILVDYRPFAGGFHITGGLYSGGNELTLEATTAQDSYDVGDNTYTSNDLNLKSEATFGDTVPYVGIGWGNAVEGSGITANFDIGVLFSGSPNISIEASGTITESGSNTSVNVDQSALFQQDLEEERANIQSDVEDFELLPVVQFNIGYKF